jgi:ketosteroid isomerase-like protein
MGHPNEDLVRSGYDAFAAGDMDTLRQVFAPDAVWHTPGRSVLAGDHRGIDAILGFFAQTMELTAGTFRAELHDVVAGDQHGVGLHLSRGERQGRTLEDRSVLVFHVRDGKATEVWQYVEDQDAFDQFLS